MKSLLTTTALSALLFAAPALAQNYHVNPTPQERQQTQQLNDQAASGAQGTATPAAAPAPAIPPGAAPAVQDDAATAPARSDYDRQMQNYDNSQAAYARDRARYAADRAAYARHWDVFYGYRGFRDVAAMGRHDLMGLRVVARGGTFLGRIRDVDRDRFGHVMRISVSLDRGRIAWLDADDLRYDPAGDRVVTTLSRDDAYGISRYPRF